jgi:hypothetical protein
MRRREHPQGLKPSDLLNLFGTTESRALTLPAFGRVFLQAVKTCPDAWCLSEEFFRDLRRRDLTLRAFGRVFCKL